MTRRKQTIWLTDRTKLFLALLVLTIVGIGTWLNLQQPEASSTGYTYYCHNKSDDDGMFDSSTATARPPAAIGTFVAGTAKPIQWTWQPYAGVTYSEPKRKLRGAEGAYEEQLTGYNVSVWYYRGSASEDTVLERATVTESSFSTDGGATAQINLNNGGGGVYKIQYQPICSTNDPARSNPSAEYSSFSNEVVYKVTPSSDSSQSPSTPTITTPTASASSDSTPSTATSAPAQGGSTEELSTSNSSSSTPSPAITTDAKKVVVKTNATAKKTVASSTPTSPEAAPTPKQTELYSTASSGLPADTITDAKTFVTLPGSSVSLALAPKQAVKTASVIVDGQSYSMVKNDATGQYAALVDAPTSVGAASAMIKVTYADGSIEELPVTVTVVAKGVVSDTAGQPVAGVTVTLEKQSESGTFVAWDPGATDQQNPMTTDSSGAYGFVAEAGDYRVIATTTDGQSAESDLISVRPMNGPVVPNLTLVAAASSETSDNTGTPLGLWLIVALVVLGLFGAASWWRRSHSIAGDTSQPTVPAAWELPNEPQSPEQPNDQSMGDRA